MSDIKELITKKRAELGALEAKAKPLRDFIADTTARLAPMQGKLYEAQQALKVLEQPTMHNLQRELAALNQALPGGERE